MTFERTYGTLSFMNIYLFKVNSVHLSIAKHICPNSWLLESWVFDFEYEFWDLMHVMRPQLQSTCHYIVSQYVKIIARASEGCK